MGTIDQLNDDISKLKGDIRMLKGKNDGYREQLKSDHSQTTRGITPEVLVKWIDTNDSQIAEKEKQITENKKQITENKKQITIAAYNKDLQGSASAVTNFAFIFICR
jgi:cell division protein FtsL